MKRKTITAFLLCTLLALPAFAHDLFLKPDSFFAKINQKFSISVMNGTFQSSEGAVTFARLTDVSVVSPSGTVSHPLERHLTKNDTTAFLNISPKEAGNKTTDSYKTILGYAVEMVPQQNPYKLKKGSSLDILCLKDGKPLAGQIVTTGYEAADKMLGETSVRTDKDGMLKVKLIGPGKWYAKFINMVKIDDPKLNYESKWATLTFEIK